MNEIGNNECRLPVKNCPRCGIPFECKAADIRNCRCNAIKLSEEAAAFISTSYEDCLCIRCLTELNGDE